MNFLKTYFVVEYLKQTLINGHNFEYVQNIVGCFDAKSKISFNHMNDAVRSNSHLRHQKIDETTGDIYDLPNTIPGIHIIIIKNVLFTINFIFSGVNTSYIYFGSNGSFFVFHVEDHDLASINRSFFGAAKIWFSLPERNYGPFVDYMK
jgi:hypothetical protein